MAFVQPNTSKKTNELLNYKWVALLGRDELGKQIRLTKRVDPIGLTPAKEKKEQQSRADEWEKAERAAYEKQRGMSAAERAKARRDKQQITLADFIDKVWIPKHVKNGKHTPSTVSYFLSMARDIKLYFQEKLPGIKLADVGREEILDYLRWMQTEALTQCGNNYSKATIQHHFSTLRNVLEFGVYLDYREENPCKKIKPEDRPRRENKEVDFLASDEAIAFLHCLDSETERAYWEANHGSHLEWRALVYTLLLTGLRRGELVGLQWGDLDTKELVLSVRRNVTLDTTHKGEANAEKIHIGELKGKIGRRVPVSRFLAGLLVNLKTEQEKRYGPLMPGAYIFGRADDRFKPMYPTEPTRLLRKFEKRHGLREVSPHDLRHSAASLAIESGASVKEVQSLLGHKDPAVTLKFYAGITDKAQRRTVEGIEALIFPKAAEERNKQGAG